MASQPSAPWVWTFFHTLQWKNRQVYDQDNGSVRMQQSSSFVRHYILLPWSISDYDILPSCFAIPMCAAWLLLNNNGTIYNQSEINGTQLIRLALSPNTSIIPNANSKVPNSRCHYKTCNRRFPKRAPAQITIKAPSTRLVLTVMTSTVYQGSSVQEWLYLHIPRQGIS